MWWWSERVRLRESWKMLNSVHLDRSDDELENWWRRGWIPFGGNDYGDFIVVDTEGTFGGQQGQVVEFTHDDACRVIHAPSLESFLAAYHRGVEMSDGRFSAGRIVAADDIPAAIEAFIRISEGTPWAEAGIPGLPMRVGHDIRSYYETAALAMVDHAPAAWASTRWFLDQTETGKVMMAARQAMQDQDAPQPMWFYLTPGDR